LEVFLVLFLFFVLLLFGEKEYEKDERERCLPQGRPEVGPYLDP
jgi:hypothetical protein